MIHYWGDEPRKCLLDEDIMQRKYYFAQQLHLNCRHLDTQNIQLQFFFNGFQS
jgi:hypothetical protein